MKTKAILQSLLTADCMLIQIWGLSACENCKVLNKDERGGPEIRKALLEGECYGPVGPDGLEDRA